MIILLSMLGVLFLTLYSVRRGASNPFEFRLDPAPTADSRLDAARSSWSDRRTIFADGARYRTIVPANDAFKAGEVLAFVSAAYNQFASNWVYEFHADDGGKKLWQLADRQPLDSWRGY